jgi:hypothetical protein
MVDFISENHYVSALLRVVITNLTLETSALVFKRTDATRWPVSELTVYNSGKSEGSFWFTMPRLRK